MINATSNHVTKSNSAMMISAFLLFLTLLAVPQLSSSFSVAPRIQVHCLTSTISAARKNTVESKNRANKSKLYSSQDDAITVQLAKAKELLAKSKAKVAAGALEAGETKKQKSEKDSKSARESVIKSKNEETGLITTDGELMAELSEEEDWEVRSLLDVFETETKDENTKQDRLADRDVSASIMNMRIHMHNDDYRRVFNKRNRFIGEDN
mmetsp:Transcript_27822/g.31894  ORF Transcript_27822/g.31894 Transcript_27822/m.31894 type:complete len:210 (+) Transcript_27822:106-735(+)